eukprot:4058095-Amphidinium_carterae.1
MALRVLQRLQQADFVLFKPFAPKITMQQNIKIHPQDRQAVYKIKKECTNVHILKESGRLANHFHSTLIPWVTKGCKKHATTDTKDSIADNHHSLQRLKKTLHHTPTLQVPHTV